MHILEQLVDTLPGPQRIPILSRVRHIGSVRQIDLDRSKPFIFHPARHPMKRFPQIRRQQSIDDPRGVNLFRIPRAPHCPIRHVPDLRRNERTHQRSRCLKRRTGTWTQQGSVVREINEPQLVHPDHVSETHSFGHPQHALHHGVPRDPLEYPVPFLIRLEPTRTIRRRSELLHPPQVPDRLTGFLRHHRVHKTTPPRHHFPPRIRKRERQL